MKTSFAAALFAVLSLPAASAFDNTTCQTFLVGTWVADDHQLGRLHLRVFLSDTKAVLADSAVPSRIEQGIFFARTWWAEAGAAPERCLVNMTGLDREGLEYRKQEELSVVDDNTIYIIGARSNFKRQ